MRLLIYIFTVSLYVQLKICLYHRYPGDHIRFMALLHHSGAFMACELGLRVAVAGVVRCGSVDYSGYFIIVF